MPIQSRAAFRLSSMDSLVSSVLEEMKSPCLRARERGRVLVAETWGTVLPTGLEPIGCWKSFHLTSFMRIRTGTHLRQERDTSPGSQVPGLSSRFTRQLFRCCEVCLLVCCRGLTS